MVGSLPNRCQVGPDKNLKGITHLIFLKNDHICLIQHHPFFRTHKAGTFKLSCCIATVPSQLGS